jgi:CDGSH-type Zn-finger protein
MDASKDFSKPKIVPLPNGPFSLIISQTPEPVNCLQNSKGEAATTVRKVSLCRCGASSSKPFCDASHNRIGFSSQNDPAKKVADRRKDYVGKHITVHDNRAICSHAAECIRNLPSVFRLRERPWIYADGAILDTVIETVKKCPSGALSYSIDDVEDRDQKDREPMVTASKDGPYLVTGGIELAGVDNWCQGASKEHFALCRCGASNNKPFCDGTHLLIKFKDEKN